MIAKGDGTNTNVLLNPVHARICLELVNFIWGLYSKVNEISSL